MRVAFSGIFIGLIIGMVPIAQALTTVDDAEARVATPEGLRAAKRWLDWNPLTVGNALYALRDVYGARISFEHASVGPDRRQLEAMPIKFSLSEGQTLREALDLLCASSNGRYIWKRVNGILTITPSGLTEPGETIDSALDVVVSLDLDGVSTWEAILAMAREVNNSSETDRVIRPYVPAEPHINHPLEFKTDKSLSIHVRDVTAREALCEIIATSPFDIRFQYSNSFEGGVSFPNPRPKSTLDLRFYEDGRKFRRHSDRRQEEQLELILDVEKTLPVDRRHPHYRDAQDIRDIEERLQRGPTP